MSGITVHATSQHLVNLSIYKYIMHKNLSEECQ